MVLVQSPQLAPKVALTPNVAGQIFDIDGLSVALVVIERRRPSQGTDCL